MNFFFSIKTDYLSSKLTIPRFRNKSATNKEYKIFSSQIKNKKWFVEKLDCDIGEDFYFLSGDILDNNKRYLLKPLEKLSVYEKINFKYLKGNKKMLIPIEVPKKVINEYKNKSFKAGFVAQMKSFKKLMNGKQSIQNDLKFGINVINFCKNFF